MTSLAVANFAAAAYALSFAALSLGAIIAYAINLYVLIIVVWAILSWFDKGRGLVHDVHSALDNIVKPYVDIFRRFIPTAGGIDFTPIVAILVLTIVARLISGIF